jgi:hypothetical protein
MIAGVPGALLADYPSIRSWYMGWSMPAARTAISAISLNGANSCVNLGNSSVGGAIDVPTWVLLRDVDQPVSVGSDVEFGEVSASEGLHFNDAANKFIDAKLKYDTTFAAYQGMRNSGGAFVATITKWGPVGVLSIPAFSVSATAVANSISFYTTEFTLSENAGIPGELYHVLNTIGTINGVSAMVKVMVVRKSGDSCLAVVMSFFTSFANYIVNTPTPSVSGQIISLSESVTISLPALEQI